MNNKKSIIIDPSKYYESIIFKERDSKKILANDFINELIDLALNFHYQKLQSGEEYKNAE
ncbi:hypothetical protein [Bacillus massiliglaciei]|uniref:hypothetical protein n=1 Tax=Bacillus massiliglaciei TaxID=1816693 RepID=UPI000DA62340|nr:hypothetical protein [Bacillus massiliglaciei]